MCLCFALSFVSKERHGKLVDMFHFQFWLIVVSKYQYLVASKSIEIATVISGFWSCFSFNPFDSFYYYVCTLYFLPSAFRWLCQYAVFVCAWLKHTLNLFTFLEFSIYIINTKLGYLLILSICSRQVFIFLSFWLSIQAKLHDFFFSCSLHACAHV